MTDELPKVAPRRTAIVNFFFNNVSFVVVLMHGIVLVPLYLAKINIELYGAWLATGNVLAWVELVDPGLSSTLQQRVAFLYGAKDRAALGRAIGTGILLNVPLCSLPLLAMPFASHLAAWVHIAGASADILASSFRLGLFGTSLSLAAYAVGAINTGLHRPITQGLAASLSGISGLLVTMVLLIRGYGLPSLPAGLIVRAAVMFGGNALPVFIWCRRHMRNQVEFSRTELKTISGLLSFSFVGRLGYTLGERAETFLVATMLGPGAAAVLTLTGRAYEPVKLVSTRIPISMMSAMSLLAGENRMDRAEQIFKTVTRTVGLGTAVALGCVVALNQKFVTVWAGPSLFGGITLTALQGLATALYIVSTISVTTLFSLGAVKETSTLGLVESIVKVGAQFVLVRTFGILGVPLGAAAAGFSIALWAYPRAALKLFRRRWRDHASVWLGTWSAMLVAISCGTFLAFILQMYTGSWSWLQFVIAAAVLGCLAGFVATFLSHDVRRLLISLVARRRPSSR